MTIRFDPTRAIDITVDPPARRPARIGWFGPYPSRSCDSCGNPEFSGSDWGLGYRCTACGQPFGTAREWLY